MPIYEYQCDQCGKIEEVMQKFSEKPLTECKQCSGKLHKLISQNAFHLKGTGWYVTDYAGKAPKETSASPAEKNSGVAETKTTTKSLKTTGE